MHLYRSRARACIRTLAATWWVFGHLFPPVVLDGPHGDEALAPPPHHRRRRIPRRDRHLAGVRPGGVGLPGVRSGIQRGRAGRTVARKYILGVHEEAGPTRIRGLIV